jgi:hypothetical protein
MADENSVKVNYFGALTAGLWRENPTFRLLIGM